MNTQTQTDTVASVDAGVSALSQLEQLLALQAQLSKQINDIKAQAEAEKTARLAAIDEEINNLQKEISAKNETLKGLMAERNALSPTAPVHKRNSPSGESLKDVCRLALRQANGDGDIYRKIVYERGISPQTAAIYLSQLRKE